MRWTCLRLTAQPSRANTARIDDSHSVDTARIRRQSAPVIALGEDAAVGWDNGRSTDVNRGNDTPDAPSITAGRPYRRRLASFAPGLPFFCVDLFQYPILDHGFGRHFLQLRILFFQLFEPLGIGQIHIAVFTAPPMERGFGDVVFTANGLDGVVAIALAEHADNFPGILLFLLHGKTTCA